MCVKELANIAGVFPPEGENDDSYKNPGSGQAKPQWKLGVNIGSSESNQETAPATPSEPTEGATQRSEVSG